MRITCEKCKSVYSIAEKIIGCNGRVVKCAKCSYSWMVEVERPLSSFQEKNNNIPHSNNFLKILIGLFFCINSLIILLFFSESLIQYKPFKFIYNKLSIYDTQGVNIENISFKTHDNEIIIKGTLSNISKQDRVTPDIRYTMLDKNKKNLFSFTIPSSKDVLKPDSNFPINTRILNLKEKPEYLQIDIGNKLELLLR